MRTGSVILPTKTTPPAPVPTPSNPIPTTSIANTTPAPVKKEYQGIVSYEELKRSPPVDCDRSKLEVKVLPLIAEIN